MPRRNYKGKVDWVVEKTLDDYFDSLDSLRSSVATLESKLSAQGERVVQVEKKTSALVEPFITTNNAASPDPSLLTQAAQPGAVSSVDATSGANGFSLVASPSPIVGAGTITFSISNAGNARTSLGLGSIATQSAASVSITGGAIDNTAIGSTTRSTVKGTTVDANSAFNFNGTQVVIGRKTGWGSPSGTLSRAAYAAYAGQTVSNPPTQAEMQALDDAVKLLSRTVAALLTDVHGSTSGHGLIGA